MLLNITEKKRVPERIEPKKGRRNRRSVKPANIWAFVTTAWESRSPGYSRQKSPELTPGILQVQVRALSPAIPSRARQSFSFIRWWNWTFSKSHQGARRFCPVCQDFASSAAQDRARIAFDCQTANGFWGQMRSRSQRRQFQVRLSAN